MLLEVYDKNSLDRVDIIRTYTFVQYVHYFNDVGSFTIKVPMTEKSLPNLLKEGNYILFEKLGNELIMGVIKRFHKEGLEAPIVTISGFLLNHILSYRSILRTVRYTGTVFDIERYLVTLNFINVEDSKRLIDQVMLANDYPKNSQTVTLCETGEKISDVVRAMNLPYNYGYSLLPAIAKYDPSTGKNQNIVHFVFHQYIPSQRTIGNGVNSPVVFDMDLSNLSELVYEENFIDYCSTAIVAGEDSGDDRKIVEAGDTTCSGIDRIELYVDARDIQSEISNDEQEESGTIVYDENGNPYIVYPQTPSSTMSDEDYENALISRGNEKLQDYLKQVNFEATAFTATNNSFKYGVDYFNGDFVTIIDRQLGLSVDVQITAVTKSLTESGEILDLTFGNQIQSLARRFKRIK